MDWLGQAATLLREWLTQQAWLDGCQSSIARTPDWALLAAGPVTLLLLALLLRIAWPGLPTSDTKPKAPQAQIQSRQHRSANISPVATKSPPAAAPAPKLSTAQLAGPPIPIADDDEDNRSVRVFVSSTFLDMQTERDELVTKTFPALRAKYRARGVELFEVDLRWGITKEQQERGETLPTLLAEIDRCRPYFIGLLGDRYGWVPPPAALTDKLKADYPVLAEAQGASVTAMEIMHGVLSNPDMAASACFFERDPNWDWHSTLNDSDRVAVTAEPETARLKLADLKADIRQKARVEAYARPEEIGPKVAAALDALLEARFPEADAPDAFEQTARLHRAYARERRFLHVGAKGYIDDLNRWMETRDAAPLLVTGASGGGKSTLVANWLNAWRKAHATDIIFEHYLGASPDSAEPMLIMQRLWEHLNRATGETVAPPGDNVELMDMSAALAQRLAQAHVTAERGGARLLIALDGLDKLSSEQNLRWLPIVPGVRWLASSLPGESNTAALARGFAPLDVKPLNEQERRDFIAGTLGRWGRRLEAQHFTYIMHPAAAELAGSPLYLKTVLEELRVSADNARLAERLDDYRGAQHMPDLFDRVLKRLEDDCEPGLVAKALPLIWASRAGLEETEIIAITGASRLAWATLRNGLGDGLRDRQGRLTFSHDFLNHAVATRYLGSDEEKRFVHLALADLFETREPDARQAEELPFQLRAAGMQGAETAWERLEVVLTDLNRFELLQRRGYNELWSYWLPLQARGRDAETLLCRAFLTKAGEASNWSHADIQQEFALRLFVDFLGGETNELLAMDEQCVAACVELMGSKDRWTLISKNNLATTLKFRGELDRAEELEKEILETQEETLGEGHPDTLTTLNNLAGTYVLRGDAERARVLQIRTLEARTRTLGPNHIHTLTDMGNLAANLEVLGDLDGAHELHVRAYQGLLNRVGAEDINTITQAANLVRIMALRGDFDDAQALAEHSYETTARLFGPQHLRTLSSMDELADVLRTRGDFEGAQQLNERTLKLATDTFGPNHLQAVRSKQSLAETFRAKGNLRRALQLHEEVLDERTQRFGADTPQVLSNMNYVAIVLSALGQFDKALAMHEHILDVTIRLFGAEHPMAIVAMNNLAEVLIRSNTDLARARRTLTSALEVQMRVYSPDHPAIYATLHNLALTLLEAGQLDEALAMQEHVLNGLVRLYGVNHPQTLRTLEKIVVTHRARGELSSAQANCSQLVERSIQSLGLAHPDTVRALELLRSLER